MHEFMVYTQWAQSTIWQAQKSIKSTDKGPFAINNALPECDWEHWVLYWLVVNYQAM